MAGPRVSRAHAAPVLPVRLDGVGFSDGGRVLLREVSFVVGSAGRTLILGPNGAGKSLLLRLLHGLLEPTAGRIVWADPDPRRLRAAQAMVFQRVVLLRRSVSDNVLHALAVRGVPRARRRQICTDLLERTGLAPLARRPARTLSGGEQQRVAIARAWALDPELLLLDEPTANLDPAAVLAVEELIRSIDAAGSKIVMTTHDLHQARRIADDVVFLHRGRCVEHTAAPVFFDRAASEEARDFLSGKLLA